MALIFLLPSASAFVAFARLPTDATRSCPVFALTPSSSLLANAVAGSPDLLTSLQQFQDSHTVIITTLSAIAIRVVISEVRSRIERPVMNTVGEKVRDKVGDKVRELTPDTDQIGPAAWAKLAACIALDLAGDASNLYSVLGESWAKILIGAGNSSRRMSTDINTAPCTARRVHGPRLRAYRGWAALCALQELRQGQSAQWLTLAHSSLDAATLPSLQKPVHGPSQAPLRRRFGTCCRRFHRF